ncbi:hypothetical protein ACQRBF_01155 [Peptoniphilaceae bacterium SGI.131]
MIKKYINKSLIILMGIFLFSFSSVRATVVANNSFVIDAEETNIK